MAIPPRSYPLTHPPIDKQIAWAEKEGGGGAGEGGEPEDSPVTREEVDDLKEQVAALMALLNHGVSSP